MALFNINIDSILDLDPNNPKLQKAKLHLSGPQNIGDVKRSILDAALRGYKETSFPLAGPLKDTYRLHDTQTLIKVHASRAPTHFRLPSSSVSTYTIGVTATFGAVINLGAAGGIMLSTGTPSLDFWNKGIVGVKTGFGSAVMGVFTAYIGKSPSWVAAGQNLVVGVSAKVPWVGSGAATGFIVFKVSPHFEFMGFGGGIGIASPGGSIVPGCTVYINAPI